MKNKRELPYPTKLPGLTLNQRELATVLAALRHFQKSVGGFNHPEWSEHFTYPSGRAMRPLDLEEIDELCERINGRCPN